MAKTFSSDLFLTSTACPSSRSKPTTQMQCSQAENRSQGSRRGSSASSSPPGPGSRVISSAGEMLLASWSSRSSGSSTCSPSSSGLCRAMTTARYGNLDAPGSASPNKFSKVFVTIPRVKTTGGQQQCSSHSQHTPAAGAYLRMSYLKNVIT